MPRKIRNKLLLKSTTNETTFERIKAIRKNRNLTQEELAKRIGIKRHVIADYESGRNKIYDEMITAIAIALNISADEILGLKPLKNIDMNTSRKRIRHPK